jgi:RimJ/RimL family protein N-acetyltransferase
MLEIEVQKINKSKNYFLECELFYFVKIDSSYISDEYCKWLNDPDITKFMNIGKVPISFLEMENYISSTVQSNTIIMFAICIKENNRHIGNIKLWNIDWINRSAIISIMIGDKEYNGLGIATNSIKLICDYAFNTLNIHKINVDIQQENIASIRVFEKNGFIKEGLRLDDIFYDGKWCNRVLMGKRNPSKK